MERNNKTWAWSTERGLPGADDGLRWEGEAKQKAIHLEKVPSWKIDRCFSELLIYKCCARPVFGKIPVHALTYPFIWMMEVYPRDGTMATSYSWWCKTNNVTTNICQLLYISKFEQLAKRTQGRCVNQLNDSSENSRNKVRTIINSEKVPKGKLEGCDWLKLTLSMRFSLE